MGARARGSIVESGGYANIVCLGDGRVLKAFRRKNHTHEPVGTWSDHDAVTRAIFRAEARAYERLQTLPSLEPYVPRYYGRANPGVILGLPPDDMTYVTDCGLILEFVPGRARKLAHLAPAEEEQVAAVVEQIRDSVGIDNPWDASCFIPGARKGFTVIDFAYWNAAEYEMALTDGRVLSAEMRERLERENAD